MTSAGVAFGLVAGAATSAHAGVRALPGRVSTDGAMLNVRTDPSTVLPPDEELPDGTRIRILCRQAGERVVGTVRTTRFWDLLYDGRYVSDAYVVRAQTPPRCGQKTGQVQAPASPAPAPRAPTAPIPDSKATGGWVLPIRGRVGSGYRTKDRPDHDGVDIAANRGTPIRAAATGKVITAECNASTGNCNVDGSPRVGGCGWYVDIRHRDRVVTRYCHMVRRPLVKVGQRVKAGQIIGYVGSSGNSSGPHLHFEVHKGVPAASGNAVNPVPFLRGKGLVFRRR